MVVAVGPHQLEALLPDFAPEFAYQPIFTCYLQYPERVRLPLPMLGLDAGLVQWVFDRGALLGERGRLACVISAQGEHQQLSHEELAAACARELAQALPRLPARACVARDRRKARHRRLHAGPGAPRPRDAVARRAARGRLHRPGISAHPGSRRAQRRARRAPLLFSNSMSWDPAQYLKFSGERLRPALDLLARVPAAAPRAVVDLGCGAGNLMPLLRARWPQARLTGVDGSPQMLAKARADHPQVEFIQADVGAWRPAQPVDVLYSNATLHWLDGHERLFPALLQSVAPGRLARGPDAAQFQRSVAQRVRDTIQNGPWRARLEPHLRPNPVAEPRFYWRLLHDKAAALEIWEIEYLQVLRGDNPVAEFVKGSWLKPFLDLLDAPERGAFEADYRARVRAAYPPEADGSTLFPFRRLFILAQKG